MAQAMAQALAALGLCAAGVLGQSNQKIAGRFVDLGMKAAKMTCHPQRWVVQ
jgi:hypothetical protein